LALAPGHRVHREEVLELLWPETPVNAAANRLHGVLHATRRILEPDLPPRARSAYLRMDGEHVALCPDGALWTDVAAFESAAAAAETAQEPATCLAAITLYGGELLPEDRYEEWAARRREELHTRFVALLRRLAELCRMQGDMAGAIAALEQLIAAEPMDEPAYAALMRLYAATGRRAQALRLYRQLRETLQRELEIEPEAATQRLYDDILRGTFASEGEVPVPGAWPAGRGVRSPAQRRHNLPARLTSFVGREREIAEVTGLLARSRLVTLTGTGGCGKTRLALEVAARVVDWFADGAWLVELAALTEGQLVVQAVASTLGLRQRSGRPLTEMLVEYVQPRHLLLLLDNCEHLISDCAALADLLLRACPRLHILATSREALGVAGETRWRVPSLHTPDPRTLPAGGELPSLLADYDAVRLFVDRARLSEPGFTLTPQNAVAVVHVCYRLDGLPLAIELAAARVNVLPVEQIAARLDDVFQLLEGGSRTALPRQQTLQAMMDWSYDLLSEKEQRLLRRLGVFADGATLETVEAVCAGGSIDAAEVLGLLASLVNKSLVIVEEHGGEARYRLLEIIRQYATEKLRAAGEETEVRRRHLDWYLRLAERAEPESWGAAQRLWLERLELEHENLRAALAWGATDPQGAEAGLRLAAALWNFWWMRGYLGEGRRWLKQMLHRQEEAPLAARAKGLHASGVIAYALGDHATANQELEQSLTLYQSLGDRRGIALNLTYLGMLARHRGEYARASTLLEKSVTLFRGLGETWAMAVALNVLGDIAADQRDYGTARTFYEQGLRLLRHVQDTWGTAFTLVHLGRVAYHQGEHRHAVLLCREALTLLQELGVPRGTAACLETLAGIAAVRGQLDRATRLFGAAAALRRSLGTPSAPQERADNERVIAMLRDGLGAEAFAEAWAAGSALSMAQAVAEALAVEPDAPSAGP
jgi:predicted ATPase/DNA-binding SARP family transcriptional activator